MYRDPFKRLPRPGWRGALLAVGCIGLGMFIQMITGGNMLGGSVAAVFCLGGTLFLLAPNGPQPSVLDPPPTATRQRLLAWVFTALAMAAALAAVLIPWEPGADFDVLGILFLITNILPVSAVFAALFFGSLAVSYWLRFLTFKSRTTQSAREITEKERGGI